MARSDDGAASGERSAAIEPAGSAGDLAVVRRLFAEYAAGLDVDLAEQGFGDELANLPGRYAGPGGALFIARDAAGAPLGCVGLRPFRPGETCEIKRLFVRPAGRGTGAGGALVLRALGFAAEAGYRRVVLDTLPSMTSAARLYLSLGFAEIPPYAVSPFPGTLYFGRSLPAA